LLKFVEFVSIFFELEIMGATLEIVAAKLRHVIEIDFDMAIETAVVSDTGSAVFEYAALYHYAVVPVRNLFGVGAALKELFQPFHFFGIVQLCELVDYLFLDLFFIFFCLFVERWCVTFHFSPY